MKDYEVNSLLHLKSVMDEIAPELEAYLKEA